MRETKTTYGIKVIIADYSVINEKCEDFFKNNTDVHLVDASATNFLDIMGSVNIILTISFFRSTVLPRRPRSQRSNHPDAPFRVVDETHVDIDTDISGNYPNHLDV